MAETEIEHEHIHPDERSSHEHAVADIELDAEADRVWTALTTDDGLSAWFGPGSTIDPREGGRITTPDIATGTPRTGRVTVARPGERLEFTWWPDDQPADRTAVTITLQPSELGASHLTLARVVEARPLPAYNLGSCAAWGWRQALLCVAFTPAELTA